MRILQCGWWQARRLYGNFISKYRDGGIKCQYSLAIDPQGVGVQIYQIQDPRNIDKIHVGIDGCESASEGIRMINYLVELFIMAG
ncbi:MAG: hypothetical protein H5T37_04890 [Methanobacteriaceae archaeon]|nr:hypothetical protein [Methanobacteriaceae archaeon]